MSFPYPVISADSHVTEPPNTYIDNIDPAWRDRAPRIVRHEEFGDVFVAEGMRPIKLGLVAAAGQLPHEIKPGGRFEDMHRSGWDPSARLADQARDGVSAEVLYPTIGMVLCNLDDPDYKHECFQAYNRWILAYCEAAPDRLVGIGQTAARSPADAISDLHAIKDAGLRGIMMPGLPGLSDYDEADWDPFWAAAAEVGLPVSFHPRGRHELATPDVGERLPALGLHLAEITGDARGTRRPPPARTVRVHPVAQLRRPL